MSNKIKNARSTLHNNRPSTTSSQKTLYVANNSLSQDSKTISLSHKDSKLSDYFECEKYDPNNIPVYKFLKMQNLQQYAKELVNRGFGYQITKFSEMT